MVIIYVHQLSFFGPHLSARPCWPRRESYLRQIIMASIGAMASTRWLVFSKKKHFLPLFFPLYNCMIFSLFSRFFFFICCLLFDHLSSFQLFLNSVSTVVRYRYVLFCFRTPPPPFLLFAFPPVFLLVLWAFCITHIYEVHTYISLFCCYPFLLNMSQKVHPAPINRASMLSLSIDLGGISRVGLTPVTYTP